ncbi:Uma2 family endonuclease [Mumia sp. zg.B53]|uniref:Uma2 family endonuclease n=1 Tax=unclassified Mumia TaxID=2621872 RepID=UPI001C6E7C04|nr:MULTISPECIES: Uma2 family endonuclease [unclassified Mumia]MBW9206869.1 Uma2 family endonuclease [Mumia sp. zg.B17]MBW9210844.1 Uma2 family endonuclease [Mumia sp. zg.B21]MBW9215409.1 Uma2 family endonuclease [Mumia sp. zg.B53]MDD9350118.1 Uma2 family endonuclease [Mumia sp.]
MTHPIGLPPGRPLTRADLDTLPDDGRRYELIDGSLIITPAPSPEHQEAVLELTVLMRASCPPEMKVFVSPLDVVLAEDSVVRPDVVVARRADVEGRVLSAPPVLAVEVISPSTRSIDLLLKRSRYEFAGAGSYWVVDPDPYERSLTWWELEGGEFGEMKRIVGDESATFERPFPVTLSPSDLLG